MVTLPPYILFFAGLLVLMLLGILAFFLIGKSDDLTQAKETLEKMRKSFQSLDDQAKLIVQTDLELNKAQESLDKRFAGLDALQKTSRVISNSLEEHEIFRRLDQSLMAELGFEKNLILVYDEKKTLHCRAHIGFADEDIGYVINNLGKEENLLSLLQDGNSFSSITSPTARREAIAKIFSVDNFVLSPILSQHGCIGFVFVGNRSNASPITEGDQEVISILANQIGQSLDNARLFEQVFRSRQELELKVKDRTKELERALEEVRNISKTKSEFISAVSHELRTPLTSIKGYASILMAGKLGNIPDSAKERLGKINLHSDNLVKLINDLLDISRIESGKVEMNFCRCNILNIIDNVKDLLTPQLKDKNLQFIGQLDPKTPETLLDSSQIERVFINLISNAIKFTPFGGSITVKSLIQSDLITLEVSDTGIGIKEEDLAKLFSEFFRVENQINQNVKGTGLGLALAKKIVEAHQGKIWVTSKMNVGTTFSFTLPIRS
ncbi:MAG: GAF domain-containing sensor histidine kinase [Candidatus Omnitrophica bacterium]|nr:GAF domain-containing sensor histidine kinase [Candidatus Omnitrophota bacterium]